MKIGPRKPSIKRSLSARTTGKIKRKAKSSINPLYGKKGMGVVNDPQRAMYNKIYNKTTYDSRTNFGCGIIGFLLLVLLIFVIILAIIKLFNFIYN